MTRRDGSTTKQMQEAPKGAVYIWPVSGSRLYAVELAKHLGRDDLRIEIMHWLESRQWRGLEMSGLVLDHACYDHRMTDRAWDAFHEAQTCVRNL